MKAEGCREILTASGAACHFPRPIRGEGTRGAEPPHGGGGRGMGGIIAAAPLALCCTCADHESQWSRYRSPAPVWGHVTREERACHVSPHDWGAGCLRTSEHKRASEQAFKTLALAISVTRHLYPRRNSSQVSPTGQYRIVRYRFVGTSHIRGLSRRCYILD